MIRVDTPGAIRAPVVALAFLFIAAPAALLAQITPEQVVTIERVTSVAMSPGGKLVAYTLSKPRSADEEPGRPRSELWIVPATGGASRAVVEAPLSTGSPRWSPDGSTLAFVARLPDRDPHSQVYGFPAPGGEIEQLTHSPTGVLAFAWSPDGRSIAYTAREPLPEAVAEERARGFDQRAAGEDERHVRLWVESLGDGGERRAVTPAEMTVWSFAWAPDGTGFAVQLTDRPLIDDSYMFRRLFVVAADGGALRLLAETEGKLGSMAWSPDGRKLAFTGAVSLNDPLAQSVFVVGAQGGPPRNLTEGYEGSAQSLAWLDDETVLFLAAEGTRTALNRIELGRGRIERVAGGGVEVMASFSLDAKRRRFAAVVHTARHPREVYVGSTRGRALTRVTTHNAWLADVELAAQETIEWKGADGWRIEGVLVHPLSEQPGVRYPLVILPHGGPEGTSYDGWTTRALYPAQVLAAEGYAVLMPNYRGSGGRGVAFAKADHRDLGGKEFIDLIAGIDHLVERGLVDSDRVGISGTSYGGYFSAWAAMRYTDRFKAAVTFAGISNWISFTGTTDIPYEMSIVHWDTWWFEDPGLAWDRSPLSRVNGTRTATLVAHGLADERVHPGQSIELHTALRIKGVPTGLVLYPREPHGLLERAHQLDFMGRLLDWFGTYVQESVPATQ